MSAYVSRLIQRFVPAGEPAAVEGPLLNPFVRSRSPIAGIDQRLGVDEQLGHGLGGLEAPSEALPDSPAVTASPVARVQRKAAGPMQPSAAPAPSLAPASPSPTVEPVASVPETAKPTLAKPPLDPGPLFDPFEPKPRYFDEAPTPTSEPTAPTAQSDVVSPTTTEARSLPASLRPAATRPSEALVELRPLQPTRTVEHHWGWLDAASMSAAPQLVPSSPAATPAPARAPSPAVQLYIVPRPRSPEPLIPEPVEYPHVEAPTPSSTRQSSPAARQTQRSASTPTAQSPRRNPSGKLTIDSISQIGPLDRHFPNRRNFRLRYR